jgi:shikimate kinase
MTSVILTGMPGSGKSTLGVLLAKELRLDFIDTDILIQTREQKTLQEIIDTHDYLELRRIEELVLLENDFMGMVVATGGSAVYSEKGMLHLKKLGRVVYLSCSLSQLQKRIHNYETRGIAMLPGQSLQSLFAERRVLYERYADLVIDTDNLTPRQTLLHTLEVLRSN